MTIENTSANGTVDCAVDCVEGCVKGDECPNEKYTQEASSFIENTSLDKMLEIAEEALRKKIVARATEPRKWIMPEDLE
ncbi:hypothetical protein [Leptothoe kymatousa]|uniref:Uncharacterized protein n=1 Tax=Leptothoe kymatousa TAU-MAC 1615 TaxID=2364775 RepID=A0ABS5Y1L3_9CYAN|nr:hypothetical protein [Leptothoe kymatousa]MBT9311724.1 hypothetical protein [Leptothoe kymatousa TAU-MAC 1615]